MTRWNMPFQRELIEQRSRFDLPMSHHERQSCASTRLNHSCSCVATPFFNTIGQKQTSSHRFCNDPPTEPRRSNRESVFDPTMSGLLSTSRLCGHFVSQFQESDIFCQQL